MDNKDQLILELLAIDASLSTYKISKKTMIPQTTVLNRIKKLKKEVQELFESNPFLPKQVFCGYEGVVKMDLDGV